MIINYIGLVNICKYFLFLFRRSCGWLVNVVSNVGKYVKNNKDWLIFRNIKCIFIKFLIINNLDIWVVILFFW